MKSISLYCAECCTNKHCTAGLQDDFDAWTQQFAQDVYVCAWDVWLVTSRETTV